VTFYFRPWLAHAGLAALTLVGFVLVSAAARAEEPPSPRTQAQQLMTEMEADSKNRALTDDARAHSANATGRASEARRKKENDNAAVLDQIALTWAQLGRILVQTVQLENQASELEALQNELETKIKRARALLEETLARKARAQETLNKLEPPAAGASEKTGTSEKTGPSQKNTSAEKKP
jgi:hypothetical protein